jgi:hypothetical protein
MKLPAKDVDLHFCWSCRCLHGYDQRWCVITMVRQCKDAACVVGHWLFELQVLVWYVWIYGCLAVLMFAVTYLMITGESPF